MRKVLSFVLVLSLVLGSFGMAFAAPLSDVAGEECNDAVNVLTELGVVKGYPDGTYRPDNIVTRAEMAVIVVSALGLADYATGTSNFKDMAGHWSNSFVAYATSLGVISGYPDGTFKPDKTVSYDEAATMLVAALGYNADSLVGTWPANFVTKAKTLGILDGIKAGVAGANRGDIAIMTYQTLDQAIGKTNKDGDWVATNLGTVTAPVADIMLERLGATLYEPAGFNPANPSYEFVLTDTLADDAVANVRDLVGAYVTAYANDDDEIIAIKEVKSVFLTGEFDSVTGGLIGNVFEADKDYDVIGSGSPAALSLAAGNYFTNGEVDPTFVAAAATVEYKIAADVSGVKIKDIYSITVWAENDAFPFEDDMLEDDNLNGHDFKLDDNDEILAGSYSLYGVDSLADIEEDDIVYVYTAGGEITRIDVGTETVSGEITKINNAGDTYTINGKAYEFALDPTGTAYYGGTDNAGDEVKLILDYAGDIYDVDSIESTDRVAIVIGVKDGTSGTFGTTPEIELVLADGTVKVFEAKPTKINDATIITTAGGTYTWQALAGEKVQPGSMVEYGLDADGVITSMNALTEVVTEMNTGSSLTKAGYYDGYKVKSDATILVYDGTVAFTNAAFFPTVAAVLDADDFNTTTLDKILDTSALRSYYHVATNGLIDFMVIHSGAVVSDEIYGVLTATGQNNSDAGFYATLLVDGVETTVDANADYITTGALRAANLLVEVKYDTKGAVTLRNVEAAPALAAVGSASAATATAADAFKLTINSNNVVTGYTQLAGAAAITVGGGFDIDAPPFTLTSDVTIYKWNGTKYVAATMSDLKGNLTSAKFFDTGKSADQDGIVDVVLITKL
ncbi:MAG: S-layer homology domain-containing protein [Eubacteriales bacterium]|nr:S-layer homology domain-containing protein [Eubacteriales bacterium]